MEGEKTFRVTCTGCGKRCQATVHSTSSDGAKLGAVEDHGFCGFQKHTMTVELYEGHSWVTVDGGNVA